LAAAAEASDATFFIASAVALGPVGLVATVTAAAESFFFPILEYI
jgi:hypothetical protein